jgi:lipopolysaccharide export LptBFGC system permease protein LptF
MCCALSWLCKDGEVIGEFFDNSVGWSPPNNGKETKSFHMKIESEKRTWYFNSYDIYSNEGQGIYLYSYDEQGNDLFRIKAKTGFLTERGWELENGYFLGFLTSKGIPILLKDHIAWDSYVLYLPEIKDDPQPFALLRTEPGSLNFEELSSLIREFPSEDSNKIHPYKLRRAQLFWNAPACLLAAFCALAISINRQQSSTGIIVGVSIIWISLFYILRTFCDALGQEGILKEWQASGIPFVLILLISIAVLCRKR